LGALSSFSGSAPFPAERFEAHTPAAYVNQQKWGYGMSIFEDLGYARDHRARKRIPLMGAAPDQVRVLIVDDSAAFGSALGALLEGDERIAVVGTVGSGEGALLFLDQIDVAVVDIGLPGIDGIELTRRLRSVSPWLRVIVLSGSDDEEMKRRAAAAGAEAVLLKCGDQDQLVESVAAGVDLPLTRDAHAGAAYPSTPALDREPRGSSDYVCPCGYGIAVERRPSVCPMCGESAWFRTVGKPSLRSGLDADA
jgi:CheY-like chemotaxis protein